MAREGVIPETVTIHLGAPDSDEQNVTLSFADYIKNVASSEMYPTWEKEALKANIWAEISLALNRIYEGYYRNRGYDFDITNDASTDQLFVYGQTIFENISQQVDENFRNYLISTDATDPLYAIHCDGVETTCDGLSLWGSNELAAKGLSSIEILHNYYGDNIEIVSDVPVEGVLAPAPEIPLKFGSSGADVQLAQVRLNRVATNFPDIPKTYPVDGVFGSETEDSVKVFQETFQLIPDGIIGPATWYRLLYVYSSVKQLSDLESEGPSIGEVSTQLSKVKRKGDTGLDIQVIQYFLNYIAQYVGVVPKIPVDGLYGQQTEDAVRAFQKAYGFISDGVMGKQTYDRLYDTYLGLKESSMLYHSGIVTAPFPGTVLEVGSEGNNVLTLQNYLNYIARTYPEIPSVESTGFFGMNTATAVSAFMQLFGISGQPATVSEVTWQAITDVYTDLYLGHLASEGQFPGYTIS